jgi:hypothetical protein
MVAILSSYYAFTLILSVVMPLWLSVLLSDATGFDQRLRDALVWTIVLLAVWLLMAKRRGFQVKGIWRNPSPSEAKLYQRLLLGVLLTDIGSQAFLFRWDRPYKVEIFKNFGLHSVFHPAEFELFHFVLLVYFLYVFLLGTLFFRFSNKHLDRIWFFSGTFALGSVVALFGARLLFGGVYNSLYFAGPLMWICPPCASPRFSSYAWTPADLFVLAAFLPVIVLFISYFVPPHVRTNAPD